MPWNARGGLPKDAYDELAQLLPKPLVLAWGRGEDVLVAGLSGHIAIRDAQGWRVVGWHQVDLARWDGESGVLSWAGQTNERVTLTEPGRIPMLLKDRVEASILVSERIKAGAVHVQLSGRRDLANPEAPLVWSASAADGRSLDRPGVREAVDRRLAELKADVE
ncbi:MAG TPA: hypothetical protein PKM36_11940 [Propionibacteriaceae bacterium]|nr:hypothetical protein [Propionibacteriaceae bacterium]HPZ49579.1 hypothetical protein [Propionibacteriaceae bacterium]